METKDRVKFFKDRKIIGIDPGDNGGISVYSLDKHKVIEVIKMPSTPQELLRFLRFYQFNSTCYLEKVQGLPGMGGSRMFNFGKGFGHLEMALLATKIPTVSVTPQKWQKALQLGHKGSKTTAVWKNKLKAKAEQLFPYVGRITLATSDSLLIVQYAIEQEK
jgi:hypothetical protein